MKVVSKSIELSILAIDEKRHKLIEYKYKHMKFRVLIFAVIAIAAGVVAWIGFNDTFNKDQMANAYIPRSEFQAAQGIKGAFEYYKSIKSNIYTGEVELEDFIQARGAIKALEKSNSSMAKNSDVSWSSMGPDNVGGRTRAILPFPNDVNTLIAGGVSGGLFKSTDAGQNWNKLPTFEDNLVVSTIAMIGNGAIYVGTGHSREGISASKSSGFMGGGLFVSIDNGDTWNLVNDFAPSQFNPSSNWANINKVVADGNNPDRLWIGTNFGIFPFIHGSSELGALPAGINAGGVKDLAISKDGKNLITAIGARIYVSRDYGASFERVNDTGSYLANNAGGFGAVDFDVSSDDNNFMVASMPDGGGSLLGIFATRDAGVTWNMIAPSSNGGTSATFAPFSTTLSTQGNYDNMITIAPGMSPTGDVEIIMGGIKLYKYTLPPNTTPGIFQWEGINENFASAPGLAPSPYYVHSDIHTAVWDAQGRLYIGSDGGIARSSDRGNTWVTLNKNYITTQYYAIAFSPTGQVLGGTQDNGTLWLSLEGQSGKAGVEFTGGDGFDCEISQLVPNFMFSTLYNGTVFRSAIGGGAITTAGNLNSVSNGGGTDFYTDIALHENINNQFSESYINYMPMLDDPYLNLFPEGQYELTANGDTIIGKVPANTNLIVDGKDSEIQASKILTEDINFYSYYKRTIDGQDFIYHNIGDTIKIKEIAQFMLSAALSNGLYLTRQPLKVNGEPQWTKIALGESGANPTAVEFSPDGDHLYVGYSNGKVVRYSGLNGVWDLSKIKYNNPAWGQSLTKATIHNGSSTITDIDVDYSQGQGTTGGDPASGKVVISLGNFGGSGKIRVSETANTVSGAGTFASVWNVDSSIEGMPCYSVVMDVNNPNIIMAGTEYGVYYTDNNGSSWSSVNNGDMVKVPVFDLRQQKLPKWMVANSGVVYAGSHGSGIFKTDYLLDPVTGIEHYEAALSTLSKLKIYPNPVASNGTVQFDLGVSDKVSMSIYTLDGKLIETVSPQTMESGKKKEIRFNASSLAAGIYIIQVKVGNTIETGKFVKTQNL